MKGRISGVFGAALGVLLAGCAGGGGSLPRDIYALDDRYYYLPLGYTVVCERRDWVLRTPGGESLSGNPAVQELRRNSAAEAGPDPATVQGRPVFGLSETRCNNGYGRWGAAPSARPEPQRPSTCGSVPELGAPLPSGGAPLGRAASTRCRSLP